VSVVGSFHAVISKTIEPEDTMSLDLSISSPHGIWAAAALWGPSSARVLHPAQELPEGVAGRPDWSAST